jgi:hypothetical protein
MAQDTMQSNVHTRMQDTRRHDFGVLRSSEVRLPVRCKLVVKRPAGQRRRERSCSSVHRRHIMTGVVRLARADGRWSASLPISDITDRLLPLSNLPLSNLPLSDVDDNRT